MNGILVLEDEESVNRGITFTLEKEGYQVYSCSTVSEATLTYLKKKPQLLICDITLPDGNGLEFVRSIRKNNSTHIIFLTALDQEIDYVMGYEAGADDYIAKPFSLSVLTLKVSAFFKKQHAENKYIIQSGTIQVHLSEMKVWNNGSDISLTKNEWKMLQLFIANPKQIISKKQILEQLFDLDGNFVDDNTIAVNIRRLREKIEPDAQVPEYIKNIRGIGYVWNKECYKMDQL